VNQLPELGGFRPQIALSAEDPERLMVIKANVKI
jgi:hypothetical protein